MPHEEPTIAEEADIANEEQPTTTAASVTAETVELGPFSTLQQAEDGYWLVDSAETLSQLLTAGETRLRLAQDLALGTGAFELYDDFILDGQGFTITYNKTSYYERGFYLEENGATVTMKNIQFGNADGSEAIGYYGIVTGHSSYYNMSLIYENVTYNSSNGQPIYNPNGRVIFRGNNSFTQSGTSSSTYSQEFAETNYLEVENGKTIIQHNTAINSAFLYSWGTLTNNADRYTSQVIVRAGATFDATTSMSFFYTAAGSYTHRITVEDGATFNVTQTQESDTTRDRFFYHTFGSSSVIDFSFGKDSQTNLQLQKPIQISGAGGTMEILENAEFSLTVATGQAFSVGSYDRFTLSLENPAQAIFSGTAAGTLGLARASAGFENLLVQGDNHLRLSAYEEADASEPSATIDRQLLNFNVNGSSFTATANSGAALTSTEAAALANSKKLIFQRIQLPQVTAVSATNIQAQSALLRVSAQNFGSPATEVKYLLYTELDDTVSPEKAKHIIKQTAFDELDTTSAYNTSVTVADLNPNTVYWLQVVITSGHGLGELSAPVSFITSAALTEILALAMTETSASINGQLASDIGFWTDHSSGEAEPAPDQPADYGAAYQKVLIEYSTDPAFTVSLFEEAELSGAKNENFTAELNNLASGTAYYVRLHVVGADGTEQLLQAAPVLDFTTAATEIMDVEIPVSMIFTTQDKDLGTADEGTIYSGSKDYQITNKGTVPVAVSTAGITAGNPDAEGLTLLNNLNGTIGTNQLALALTANSGTAVHTIYLTAEEQFLLALDSNEQTSAQLSFSGKFYGPQTTLRPQYQLTLKFERSAN